MELTPRTSAGDHPTFRRRRGHGPEGVVAKWVRAGAEVHGVLCTDGSKGVASDPEVSSEELVEVRAREQLEAAEILGVKNFVMLG